MGLNMLESAEMVEVSAPWVTPEEAARAAIEKYPSLAGLLPQLEKVHGNLFALHAKEPSGLASLRQRELQVDARHDSYVHLIYDSLTLLAKVASDGEDLLALRDRLFPEGLSHVRKSFRAEAGHAALVDSQMDDTLRAKMKTIVLHQITLFDGYQQWQSAAKQLGALEEERAHLTMTSPSLASELRTARYAWVRVAKLLLANAEVAEIDKATDELLFSPLRAAERAAASRIHSKPPAPAPNPPPTT